jgi:hypothetical protein
MKRASRPIRRVERSLRLFSINNNEEEMISMSKIKEVIFKVVGVSFKNEDGTSRQEIISKMTNESNILLVREPQNLYDTNAVAIYADMKQIGYVGKEYAGLLSQFMDGGQKFTASVIELDKYKNTWYCKIQVDEV